MSTYKSFITVCLVFILSFSFCIAQTEIQQSLNGKSLPASGILRVLVVFAEIDYDVNPNKDPLDRFKGTKGWPKGELPTWKDDLFDPYPSKKPKAKMTKFFHDCSFGNMKILGDYVDEIITIKESDVKGVSQYHRLNQALVLRLREEEIKTANNFSLSDFDLWTLTRPGYPKITPSTDDPMRFDHVMIVYRNYYKQPSGTGRAAPGRFGQLFGYNTDTYSIFGAYEDLPFNMARHEFIHLVLGDNNFHAGGGQSLGTNYFIPQQGGWSILGAANSSFMICNAWDRYRLGWKGPGKKHLISAITERAKEIETDLDAENPEHEGTYILRDYVSTGDALRIKLPGIQSNEYPQWIWLENHQTKSFNHSDFDTFQFSNFDCVDDPVPGIYAYLQVDKDAISGDKLYSGYGDYLRAIPATGFYDFIFEEEKVKNRCVNDKPYNPFIRKDSYQNPLTGNNMLEFPAADFNNDGKIAAREAHHVAIEKTAQGYEFKLPFLGHAGMAFTATSQNHLGIGTNPSTANMYTLVSAEPTPRGGVLGKDGFAKPNNRKIYLNGVSIKILEQLTGGRIKVQIKFNETKVGNDVRWCADSIVLPDIAYAENDLHLTNGAVLTLDHGLTPTRIHNPVDFGKDKLFAEPTQLFVKPNAKLKADKNSKINLTNRSKLILMNGSELFLSEGAVLDVKNGSDLIIGKDAKVTVGTKAKIIVRNKAVYERIKKQQVIKLKGGKFKFCR